jgi:hypothetical protein
MVPGQIPDGICPVAQVAHHSMEQHDRREVRYRPFIDVTIAVFVMHGEASLRHEDERYLTVVVAETSLRNY